MVVPLGWASMPATVRSCLDTTGDAGHEGDSLLFSTGRHKARVSKEIAQ